MYPAVRYGANGINSSSTGLGICLSDTVISEYLTLSIVFLPLRNRLNPTSITAPQAMAKRSCSGVLSNANAISSLISPMPLSRKQPKKKIDMNNRTRTKYCAEPSSPKTPHNERPMLTNMAEKLSQLGILRVLMSNIDATIKTTTETNSSTQNRLATDTASNGRS